MSEKRAQNREDQRRRILDAARLLFATRGLDQVPMAEIAGLAGVARATVFNYFPSKYALVEAITDDVLAAWVRMLERALALESTPVPTLVRALFAQMGAGIETYHGFYRGVFREIVRIQVGLDEGGAAERRREVALDRLRTLLARGQERGELVREHDAGALAIAFDALANGTLVHWLYEDASGPLRAHMLRAAEIFLGPVAAGVARSTDTEPLPDLFDEEDAVAAVRTVRARGPRSSVQRRRRR